MKKVFAFALVLALVFALCAPAYADGSFKIGASGGDMANGVWTPWSGLWIFFR